MRYSQYAGILFSAAVLLVSASPLCAQQTTAFTYQGQLRDGGTNANGTYTMIFKLYDAVTNGSQVSVSRTNLQTVSGGLFTANLDFGAGVFNGNARWLDINVEGESLAPRVAITPVPYALYALNSTAGTNTNGTITGNNLVLGGGGTSWDFISDPSGTLTLTYGDPLTNIVFHPPSDPHACGMEIFRPLCLKSDSSSDGSITADGPIETRTNFIAGGGFIALSGGLTLAGPAGKITFPDGSVQSNAALSVLHGIRTFESPGTYSFTVPAGVSQIQIEAWGGGGGGSNRGINSGISGACGGAGGYARGFVSVSPASVHSIVIGAGGAGTDFFNYGQSGGDGGETHFGSIFVCGGGHGGSPGAGGAGGQAEASAPVRKPGKAGDIYVGTDLDSVGTPSQYGTLQPPYPYNPDGAITSPILYTYGSGGGKRYGEGAATGSYGSFSGASGAIVIQW